MKTQDFFSKFSIRGITPLLFFLFITILSKTGFAQLSGIYTVGTGGDYATLKAVANDLMNQGVSGPVTMNILSGTYNEHFVLNTITGTSAINTVTFQSAAGHPDSAWITYNATGADSNYVVKLDNVQYLNFQSLTFHASGQLHSRAIVVNGTNTVTRNITINNNIFHGDSLSSNSYDRATIFSNDQNLENIHILGNTFHGGSSAIFLAGYNNNFIRGTNIVSNTFHSVVFCGINISWQDSPIIANNTVESNQYGIWVPAGIGNLQIRDNRIRAGYYGISVGHFDASGGDRSLIVNNFVSVESNVGIGIGNSINMDVYHNSVNVFDSNSESKAFELLSTSSTPIINIVNNNFASMEAGYAYYITQSSAVGISDYNNFYSAGNFIAFNESKIIALDELQNASGKNLNSISVFPNYLSDSDLHTKAPWLDNKGTNLNYVTRDIDGENRDPITPDIGADEFSSNPSSTPYAQDLTVGSGGDFSTISEAIDSLVLRGVSDSIHINIMPGLYNEQVDLISIPGSNAQRFITFQSQTSDTAEIVFNSSAYYSNYTLRLKGADFIRLKNLKLIAIGATYGRVLDYYRGANNTILENCLLSGVPSSGAVAEKAIIYSDDSYYLNRLIRNNKINQGTYGILMRRYEANDLHPLNPIISNNEIVNSGYCGIYLHWTDSLTIDGNIIQAENTGILLSSCYNQSNIIKNKIDVNSQYGVRISSCSSPPGHPILIANNFIHVGGPGAAYGFHLNNINSLFVLHNSVNITSTDVTNGRAFYLSSTTSTGISLYNNIFNNSGGGYAYYVENLGAIGTSDYNDLFTTGALLAHWLGGRADLTALQAAGGQNLNSVSAYPLYVSNTDLHTSAAVLDSAAIYMGIADDIDGQLRDQNFPDIGADEFGYFANRDPLITSSPIIIARADSLYEYQVIATDSDGDSLNYILNNTPIFLSINATTGLISGTPALNDSGYFPIEIVVNDGHGGSDSQNYTLHVISTPLFTIDSTASISLENVRLSSVNMGDYDNDGDLDILLTGSSDLNNYISKIYNNNGGVFNDINAGLIGVYHSSADWGDYDNDGDLDILLTGYTGDDYISKIYNNDGGVFTDINAELIGVTSGSADWGDYDNDGDLDILLTGNTGGDYISKIYNNDGGVFIDINAELIGVISGSVDWGDYDNDGDLDILLTGYEGSFSFSAIFRNEAGLFTNINAGLVECYDGSVAWGDYDNDGDLDILLTGINLSLDYFAKIYRNDLGTFTDINADLTGARLSDVSWGDYDNDGNLDILLIGVNLHGEKMAKIYHNESGVFVDINAGLLPVESGDAAWGDYDNDGDLDIVLTGASASGIATLIYQNNINSPNSHPTSPSNLNWHHSGSGILFNWNTSNDQETPAVSLTYNIRIGTSPGGSEIKAAMSDSNGYRQVPVMGNVNHRTSWELNYLPSNIYWSVQAVDHGFSGSTFSVEDTISASSIILDITDVPNDQGGRVSIRWQASILDVDVNTLRYYSIWRSLSQIDKTTQKQNGIDKLLSLPLEGRYRATQANGKTAYWEWVANQPAHRLPFYSYTCETLYDSMSTTNGMHYFMVSAHTDDANVFFDSNPDSGYSIDNIAPAAPANLNAIYNNNQITLRWSPNSENDLREYVVYRSTTPDINPANDSLFAVISDTLFTDTNPIPVSDVYYIVCARDIHDNLSPASNEVQVLITGILKDGTEIPMTFALYQNFPNPFNPYTVIKFDVPKTSHVVVTVFNSLGKNVATIVNEIMMPGKYHYIWKPENLASGLYFYAVQAANFRSVKKMLLIK